MKTIKTYPELSANCIKGKLDLPLRLWYLLRQGQSDGRGWLSLDDIYHLSCGNRRQTRTWLRAGEGIFWTKTGDRYYLAGLGTLCSRLKVEPWQGTVDIPVEDIKNLKGFRATLYASWFAFKPRTISRNKLSEIFGRSKVTLLKWEKLAGVKVQRNMAWAELPKNGDYSRFPTGVLKALGIKDASEEAKPGYAWLEYWSQHSSKKKSQSCGVVFGNVSPVICWFLPSSYSSDMKTKRATTLQREARKKARQALNNGPRATERIFFAKDSQANLGDTLLRRGMAYLAEGRKYHGMNVWSFKFR